MTRTGLAGGRGPVANCLGGRLRAGGTVAHRGLGDFDVRGPRPKACPELHPWHTQATRFFLCHSVRRQYLDRCRRILFPEEDDGRNSWTAL